LALLVLVLLAGGLEAAARTSYAREHLPPPSYGMGLRQLEVQLARLDDFARARGGVYCLFLGSSEVYRGLDPVLFEDVFLAGTGRDLLCFNFGVKGLDPVGAAVLAKVLVDRYHPALIFYGLDVPNFTANSAPGFRGDVEARAWTQYEMGKPNVAGWLIDHSYALRDYLVIRNWPRLTFWEQLALGPQAEAETDRLGFGPVDRTGTGLNEPPGPAEKAATLAGMLSNFVISQEELDAFARLLAIDPGTKVLVVEMPLHPGFMQFFGNGWGDYERGLGAAQAVAGREHVILLPTTGLTLIPDSGWLSRNHLNRSGATLFTRWFATTLTQLVREGQFVLPPMRRGGRS
jgi:hypothetical protein